MKKRYLFAGLTGVVAGAVATKLLTRPRDVSWPNSLEFVYNPECSWFTRVEGVRIQKAIVVGASYGGAVAATMALDYPERVHKLIMIGAVTNDDAKKKFLLRVSCLPLIGDIATPLFLGSRWILRKRMQAMYRRM